MNIEYTEIPFEETMQHQCSQTKSDDQNHVWFWGYLTACIIWTGREYEIKISDKNYWSWSMEWNVLLNLSYLVC